VKLARVRGASKRQRAPTVLGVAQFLLLEELRKPFRTRAILDPAMGLRCSGLFTVKLS